MTVGIGGLLVDPEGEVPVLLGSGESTSRIAKHPIVGVEIPNDGGVAELSCNGPDTVIVVTLRRTEVFGGDAANLLNDSLGPFQLDDNLLGSQRGKDVVRPGMDRDMVTTRTRQEV